MNDDAEGKAVIQHAFPWVFPPGASEKATEVILEATTVWNERKFNIELQFLVDENK